MEELLQALWGISGLASWIPKSIPTCQRGGVLDPAGIASKIALSTSLATENACSVLLSEAAMKMHGI